MLEVIGLIAGLLSLASSIPYIISTINNKTSPHRVTWGIFFLLNVIFLGNQLAAGATSSIWLVVSFTLSAMIIFVLSFKHGEGGRAKSDIIVLAGALIGVVVWQVLDAPIASIIANVGVSLIAGIPTLKKAYLKPHSEMRTKWLLGSIAALLATVSVGRLELTLLLLPIYSAIYQGSVFFFIQLGIKHIKLRK